MWSYILAALLSPFLVYLLVRVGSAAYFKSRKEHDLDSSEVRIQKTNR